MANLWHSTREGPHCLAVIGSRCRSQWNVTYAERNLFAGAHCALWLPVLGLKRPYDKQLKKPHSFQASRFRRGGFLWHMAERKGCPRELAGHGFWYTLCFSFSCFSELLRFSSWARYVHFKINRCPLWVRMLMNDRILLEWEAIQSHGSIQEQQEILNINENTQHMQRGGGGGGDIFSNFFFV